MNSKLSVFVSLVLCGMGLGQDPGRDVPTRFDVIHNPELYRQKTPRETLGSVLGAISSDRYDYIVAHLLDSGFVAARLEENRPYFERVATEQIGSTASGDILKAKELRDRVTGIALRLNVKDLSDAIRHRLASDPDDVRDLKRLLRDGEFTEAGDTATATLKDWKDRAVYFKKVDGRWFLENRRTDRPAKE